MKSIQNIKTLRSHGSNIGRKIARLRRKLKKLNSQDKIKSIKYRINQLSASRQKLLKYIRTGKPANYKLPLPKKEHQKPIVKTGQKAKVSINRPQRNTNKQIDIPVNQIPGQLIKQRTGLSQVPANKKAGTFCTQLKKGFHKLLIRINRFLNI